MVYPTNMALVESITKELHELPNAKLVEVARFVGELDPQIAQRQRKALAQSFGCMDDEDGEAFEAAVLSEQSADSEN